MSYDLRDSMSIEATREYTQGVSAGLLARDATSGLAPPWEEFDQRLKNARDARDVSRFEYVRTIRRYAVLRVAFFDQLTKLSGVAFLAADKDNKAAPYVTLFGAKTAADFRELGYNKLSDALDDLFKAGESVDQPDVKRELTALEGYVTPLKAAGEARKSARRALIPHQQARAAFVVEAEKLGDRTEAAILGIFPGQKDVVRAILAPSVDTGRGDKQDNEEPDPVT